MLALFVVGTFSDGALLLAADDRVMSTDGTTNVTFESDFIDFCAGGGGPEALITGSGASRVLLESFGGWSLLLFATGCCE